jgi:hypothetical protein
VIAGLRLAPLFLRRGNRGDDLTALGLTAVGVAVATALALLALSLRPALDARDDRMAWREPAPVAQDRAVAVQRRSTDVFEHELIDRVDLAPLAATPDRPVGDASPTTGQASAASATGGSTSAPAGGPAAVAPAGDASDAANPGGAANLANSSGGGALPVPPGLARFPGEGEVFVSPALARLLEQEPAERLADRFPGTVAGTIGPDGLAHENELVAVVGHAAGALTPDPPAEQVPLSTRLVDEPSAATPIRDFATAGNFPLLESYKITASLAAVLLVVPALLLVGSAARLTAARRNQRLASLRLAGATPGAVVVLTAAETAVAALVGAVAGVAAYAALLPLLARTSVAGGTWRTADLWLGAPQLALAVAGATLLAGLCAAVALRRVVISPLGVAQRVGSRRPRSIRLLGMVAAWGVVAYAAQSVSDGDQALGVVIAGIGLLVGSLALVGPWITWVLGALLARLARRPSTLLAGRRILDDPKSAYRAISGIVLAGLVAGFLFTLGPVIERLDGRSADEPTLEGWADAAPADVEWDVTARLAAAGVDARIATEGDDGQGGDDAWTLLTVDPPQGADNGQANGETEARFDVERVRTALADMPGGLLLVAAGDDVFGDDLLVHDFRRASLALAIATMVMAATTTAIASSASILDQRPTLRRLRLAGTPVGTLQRARTWQASLPLIAATIGSLATGAGAAALLLTAAGNTPESPGPGDLATMLGVVVAGLALTTASAFVTRPLLVAATNTPTADR